MKGLGQFRHSPLPFLIILRKKLGGMCPSGGHVLLANGCPLLLWLPPPLLFGEEALVWLPDGSQGHPWSIRNLRRQGKGFP